TDVVFNMQVAKFLKKAVYIHEFFNHYRQDNPNSLTKNYQLSLFDKYLKLFSYANKEVQTFSGEERNSIARALNNRIICSLINISISASSKRLTVNTRTRIDYLRKVLHHPVYREAFSTFQFSFLPMPWRFFFTLAKARYTYSFFYMSALISKLR
ncbi:MAG: hypothetical protein ORN54_08850, partial [Cyclobacteriaceae bacterium]|nr:hypothetical protein [Cyclobacteriaceae bacterium]